MVSTVLDSTLGKAGLRAPLGAVLETESERWLGIALLTDTASHHDSICMAMQMTQAPFAVMEHDAHTMFIDHSAWMLAVLYRSCYGQMY